VKAVSHAHNSDNRIASATASPIHTARPWQAHLPQVRSLLRSPTIQPKLTLGAPNDVYEKEADRVADQVMRMSDEEVRTSPAPPSVQRLCSECEEELRAKPANGSPNPAAVVPPIVHEVLRSPGQPLDAETRSFFEPRFGQDFGDVRLHTDARAAESARRLQALAYTVGRNVVFGAGAYASCTPSIQKLLAHELAHVVQQTGSQSLGVQYRDEDGGMVIQRLSDEESAQQESCEPGATRPEEGLVCDDSGQWQSKAPTPPDEKPARPESCEPGATRPEEGLVCDDSGQWQSKAPIGGSGGAGGAPPTNVPDYGQTGQLGNAPEVRSLTQLEIDYAKDIFKDTLNYGAILIIRGTIESTGAYRTVGHIIYIPEDKFDRGTFALKPEAMNKLIHEMTHVWQYEHEGWSYAPEALWAQIRAAIIQGSWKKAEKNWRSLDRDGVPWNDWDPEAQAGAVERYNAALRSAREGRANPTDYEDLSVLQKYIDQMLAGPLSADAGAPPEADSSPPEASTPADSTDQSGVDE